MMRGLQRTAMPPAMTDDELVALALMQGTSWAGPLPTIDPTDADALLDVAPRGVRALVTRGLMAGPRGVPPTPVEPLLTGLRPALVGQLLLSVFGAHRDLTLVPGAPTGAVFADHDGAILADSVSALGVHYFSTGTVEAALSAVGRVAEQVARSGVPVAHGDDIVHTQDLVLCIAGAADPKRPGLALVVEQGGWSIVEIGVGGVPVPLVRPDSIAAAVSLVSAREP